MRIVGCLLGSLLTSSLSIDSNEIASFQIQEDDLVILGAAGSGLNFVSLSSNVSFPFRSLLLGSVLPGANLVDLAQFSVPIVFCQAKDTECDHEPRVIEDEWSICAWMCRGRGGCVRVNRDQHLIDFQGRELCGVSKARF